MGQYWKAVNLDKREYILPHTLGAGLKLWEQLANSPGVGAGLIILTAAMPVPRGGGDFDPDVNWHGTEREEAVEKGEIDGITSGPVDEDYNAVAHRTIGRWAGDRIAIVGDYAEDGDLPNSPIPASTIYGLCNRPEDLDEGESPGGMFADVSADVARVIEHELNGHFEGDGWRTWKPDREG